MREQAPEPGIYENLPAEEYFAWDAVSNSRLSLLAKSPRHYKHCAKPIESSALKLGTLTHTGRLEPLAIAQRYAVMPDYYLDAENVTSSGAPSDSKSTKYYKQKAAEFLAANDGKQIVDATTYQQMVDIVTALHGDKDACECFNGAGPVEVSIVWDDPETGIRCKARIDKINRTHQRMVDLKTTGNLFKFNRSIADYGYARQMAHYQAGWAVLNGGELLQPWLVPVESVEPYCVMAAPVGEASLESGYCERDRLMQTLAECLESGSWPGPESPETWELPAWALESEPVTLSVGGVTLEV